MPASKKELVKTPLADGRVELSGATFDFRDQIKARGGKWDPARKVWVLPAGASTEFEAAAAGGAGGYASASSKKKPRETIAKADGDASASLRKPREDWTREEWQAWIHTFRIRNRGRVERCCCHARDVGDCYGPSEYSCVRHGETKGSYRGD
jgi:hypothetical protein